MAVASANHHASDFGRALLAAGASAGFDLATALAAMRTAGDDGQPSSNASDALSLDDIDIDVAEELGLVPWEGSVRPEGMLSGVHPIIAPSDPPPAPTEGPRSGEAWLDLSHVQASVTAELVMSRGGTHHAGRIAELRMRRAVIAIWTLAIVMAAVLAYLLMTAA